MGKKDRIEIFYEILNTCKHPTKKHKLVSWLTLTPYKSNEYLSILKTNDLLEFNNITRCYNTTSKGKMFVTEFEKIKEMLNYD